MHQRSPPSSLPRFFLFIVLSVGVAFTILVGRFWLHAFGDLSDAALRLTLIGVIVLVVLLVLALTTFILGYQVLSTIKDARWRAAVLDWTRRWQGALQGTPALVPSPLPKAGIEAWLRLRESGDFEDQDLEELAAGHGVQKALMQALRRRNRQKLLQALDDLARARIEEAVEPLLTVAVSDDRTVQHAALRAAARTLASALPATRERLTEPLIEAIARARLPSIPIEEVLLLLEDAAPPVVKGILSKGDLPPEHLRAALAAARHLRPRVGGEEVGSLALHPEPEVRSAALQTVAALGGTLSSDAVDAVQAGLADERAFLRIHATRASAHLPEAQALEALWDRLGDSSWWVRVAAAETLAALGEPGRACLERASHSHPDRFARDMAQDHDADLQWKAA